MSGNEMLISNIDRIHTTEMGIGRIKRNLGLSDIDCLQDVPYLPAGQKLVL